MVGEWRETVPVAIEDRELARRFPGGDDDVVRAVYQRYGRAVYTVALSIVSDQAQAADVVQSTFLNAWRASENFDPERDLGPWLYAIARRQAIDAYRRTSRVVAVEPERLDATEHAPSIERTWEMWQVRLAVDRLPVDEQDVVRMAWFEELTHTEIAERLGVPVGTVKSRSHRAHRRLAELLAHVADANRSAAAAVVPEEDRSAGGSPA